MVVRCMTKFTEILSLTPDTKCSDRLLTFATFQQYCSLNEISIAELFSLGFGICLPKK